MAAAGSFKRPAAPALHPPLRACPSRGARGGGLRRSGSSSRVGTGLSRGWGPKAGADTRAPELRTSIAGDSARVRWRATGGGGKEEEEAGAASGAELQQRRLLCCGRGAPEVRAWATCGGGGRNGFGSWYLGVEGGLGYSCGVEGKDVSRGC